MKRVLLVLSCVVGGGVATFVGHSFLQGQAPITVAIPKELTSYRDIVKKVLPAVVSIEARNSKGGAARKPRPGDMQLPDDLRRFFDAPRFDAPRIADDDVPGRVGFGSGFLISAKGVVVTNNHVVEGADSAVVQFKDGRKITSTKIFRDPKTDMAIVLVEGKAPIPYLDFGNSDEMEIGDRVLAVGAPFGLTGTVTHGIISSVGRSLRMNMYEDFLQTDAAINPGNSGGPLVNLEGKVIGINSAIKSRSGGFSGIGLAISSNLGKTITSALLKDGAVKRGYLGVGIRDLDEERAKALSVPEASGVEVTYTYPETPGDKAGLKKGDVIVKLGGQRVRDGKELQMVVAGLPLGKPVDVGLYRDGKTKALKVTIEEQPQTFGTARGRAPDLEKDAHEIRSVGIWVNTITPELMEAPGFPDTARGAPITRMTRTGLASRSGLKPGLLITSVNGKAVATARQTDTAFAAGSVKTGIEVEVRGPRGPSRKLTITAAE